MGKYYSVLNYLIFKLSLNMPRILKIITRTYVGTIGFAK